MPWSRVAAEPFVASPSDPLSVPTRTFLTQLAAKIAGAWVGNAAVPRGGRSPGFVQIEFTRDATYEGAYASTPSSGRTAFGEVAEPSRCAALRRWRLEGVFASGAFGEIDVPYGGTYQDGGTWCTPPGGPLKIEKVTMNASATRLRFVSSRDPGGSRAGTYDLWRTCPRR